MTLLMLSPSHIPRKNPRVRNISKESETFLKCESKEKRRRETLVCKYIHIYTGWKEGRVGKAYMYVMIDGWMERRSE